MKRELELIRRWDLLKFAALAIFPDSIPGEPLPVDRDVSAGREQLYEGKRAPKIEKVVGVAVSPRAWEALTLRAKKKNAPDF